MRERPNWDEYFMSIAFLVKERSHDFQTQHGCIITVNNRIIGTGYNGFPAGMDDSKLPDTRPDKYPWMLHSERNALANCDHRPNGGVAYITGEPCWDCTLALCQAGIKKLVIADRHGWHQAKKEDKVNLQRLSDETGIEIVRIDVPLSWLERVVWAAKKEMSERQ